MLNVLNRLRILNSVVNRNPTFSAQIENLSIRLDAETKKRLEELAVRSKRSKSFLAAEAITRYVDAEDWQFGEIEAGLADLDAGRTIDHKKISDWLKSWGKARESKPSRRALRHLVALIKRPHRQG